MKPRDLTAYRESRPALDPLYWPREVAKALGCSEWWVKEQARKRRIPYEWVGGSYRFTADHVAEILRLFEVRPATEPANTASTPRPRKRPEVVPPVVCLRPRPPRRVRSVSASAAA